MVTISITPAAFAAIASTLPKGYTSVRRKLAQFAEPGLVPPPPFYGCLIKSGRPDEAIALLQRSVNLNPTVAAYHHDLGFALWSAERIQEAIAAPAFYGAFMGFPRLRRRYLCGLWLARRGAGYPWALDLRVYGSVFGEGRIESRLNAREQIGEVRRAWGGGGAKTRQPGGRGDLAAASRA